MVQKFGKSLNKNSSEGQSTKNKNRFWISYKLYLFLCAIFIILIMIIFQDKSRVMFCDIPQNYCEIQIISRAGFKHTQPICPPDQIKDITVEMDTLKGIINYLRSNGDGRYFYIMFVIDNNGNKIPIFKKYGYSLFYEKDKMMEIAEDIKYSIKKADKYFKYDMIKNYNEY